MESSIYLNLKASIDKSLFTGWSLCDEMEFWELKSRDGTTLTLFPLLINANPQACPATAAEVVEGFLNTRIEILSSSLRETDTRLELEGRFSLHCSCTTRQENDEIAHDEGEGDDERYRYRVTARLTDASRFNLGIHRNTDILLTGQPELTLSFHLA